MGNAQITVEKLLISGFFRRPIFENPLVLCSLPIFESINISIITNSLLKITGRLGSCFHSACKTRFFNILHHSPFPPSIFTTLSQSIGRKIQARFDFSESLSGDKRNSSGSRSFQALHGDCFERMVSQSNGLGRKKSPERGLRREKSK